MHQADSKKTRWFFRNERFLGQMIVSLLTFCLIPFSFLEIESSVTKHSRFIEAKGIGP